MVYTQKYNEITIIINILRNILNIHTILLTLYVNLSYPMANAGIYFGKSSGLK